MAWARKKTHKNLEEKKKAMFFNFFQYHCSYLNSNGNKKMSKTFLRMPQVMVMTGLKRSTIYALITKNQFPKPVKLTKTAAAWVESEIAEWNDDRIAERDNEAA